MTNTGVFFISNIHNVTQNTCSIIVDGNSAAIDQDNLSNGVMHWHKNKKMDELMDFLSRYVRNVHADCYFEKLLLHNPGCTYLDIITPSDIAYVISVIKNSAHLWLQKR